tara:strand:- start:724 stop:1350 length:627 start_codon:yes stop_codon:yes gene_type:complete
MKDSYSKNGEDLFIHEQIFSKRTKPGIYVDLGAGDGINNNNTLAFEKMGWNGIIQEESGDLFEELKNNRYSNGNKITDISVGTSKGILSDILTATNTQQIDLFSIQNKVSIANILEQMDWKVPVGVWILTFNKNEDSKDRARKLLKNNGYTFYTQFHGSEIWLGSDLENYNGETRIEDGNKEVPAKTTALRVLLLFALTELILNIRKQ